MGALPMKTVILAGGFGTRFAEMTEKKPKPMIPIGGQPILWHIMKYYASFGCRDFILCLGYKSEIIKDYFFKLGHIGRDFTINLSDGDITYHSPQQENWRVTLVDTGLSTGTGGRLLKIRDHLDDAPFFMTYGDGLSDIDLNALWTFHQKGGARVTVSAIVPPSRYGHLKIDNGGSVVGFDEKPALNGETSRINGGFFVLNPDALDAVESEQDMWEQAPLKSLVARGEVKAYRHTGFWQCMDTLRDQQYLQSLWDQNSAPWQVWRNA